ncbi:cell wall-binding repeat-containing protein [Clostridium tetani]|uniref:cell wall-binding repeat-containing protein n=1 Tax=Clostridium tetani TaxID=1513 RepID=UPI001027169B|nr:cell wall-binding repeat-containing protein [Clostridium tetani]RXI74943.1 cell wall-binding repeat-containing protein [Clostridium tetani]
MSKKSHKALASATVMSLVLTSTLAATNVQAAAEVTRMPGADRYTTAQTVAKKSFGKAENVILVNGLGYADSVSATPFAKLKNAPILLTDASDKPSADLTATLTELGAKNIYIVGGKGVVTEAMEKELAKNYKVERIGGNSRYETNAEIAKKVIAETKAEKAILVNGQDGYADALSVASVAATKGYPVIFGNKNNVPTVVKDAVKDVKEVLAVGGEGVLPDAVIKGLEAKRIAKGADRFDTNLKVLEHFNADFKFDNIFVAAGGDDSTSKFADALVASAAAAKHGAPVVLTGLGANKDNVDKSVKYVKGKMGDNTKVTIVGGTASVSEAIEKDLKGEKESTGKAEVQSIEALNLNQVKIVFASKVDSDAAEDVTNYEVDGTQLTKYDEKDHKDSDAIAVLQDDDRTVILTLSKGQEQHDEITVKVRKGVLSEDKTKNVKEYEKDVIFKDLVAPKVSKVTVRGNSKLVVEFSEAIFVKGANTVEEAAELLAKEFEINGQSVDSMGFDSDYSKAKDTLLVYGGAYVNKVEFYFSSALDSGTNEFKVLDGRKDDILCDAAGFTVKEAKSDIKINEVTSKPKVKSIKGGTNGKIYIDFDRPMDANTASKEENYKLNGDKDADTIKNLGGKVELKKGDTQVKITGVSDDIKTGSNVIEILDKVRDAYGNKVDEDTRISFKAEKDDVKPKVVSVTSIDSETIRVRFSEDVKNTHATNKDNYELKDKSGSDISSDIKEVKAANGTDTDDTDVYDIKMDSEKNLTGSKYTLKIKNIADTSDNVMDDYTATLNGEDDEAPTVFKVKKYTDSDRNKEKITIEFSEEMDKASIRKTENYRYIDEDKKVRELPSKATISVASDNKTVTIEFPSAYKEDGKIKGIIVKSGVKDLAGNKMEADVRRDEGNMNDNLSVNVKEKSFKLREDGDVEAELQFTAAVKVASEIDNKNETADGTIKGFSFDLGNGKKIKADTVRIKNGDKVVFKFKDEDKNGINKAKEIKAHMADLKVTSSATALKDESNQYANEIKEAVEVYDNYIAPELDVDETNGNVTNWGFDIEKNIVTIKFDTQIDSSLASAYRDDFDLISDNGTKLDVESSKVIDNTYLVFNIKEGQLGKIEKDGKVERKATETVTVRANKDKVDVRTEKDGAGNYKEYKPSNKDISGRKTNKKELPKVVADELKKDEEPGNGGNVVNPPAVKTDAEKAEDAVAKAEKSSSQTDVDAARKLVDALTDDKLKGELNTKLDAIKVVADKTALNTQIISAKNVTKVKVSADGSDIEDTAKWTTQDALDTFKKAITDAEAVAGKADATQDEVNNAKTALGAAVTAYEGAQTDGAKKTTTP